MKNHSVWRTFALALLVLLTLSALHFLPSIPWGEGTLRKVDLLSDLRPDEPEEMEEDTLLLPPLPKPEFVDSCKTGLTCIEDYADSTRRGMSAFYEALLSHRDTLPRPVRIAYFGDSFIEGDILTSDLRSLLQQHFGGCGTGFVDITSPINGFRPTVIHSYGGWESHAYTDSTGFDRALQGINSRYFIPHEGAHVELSGKDYLPRLDTCTLSTLYFTATQPTEFVSRINRKSPETHHSKATERVQSCKAKGHIGRITWSVQAVPETVCYGIAMDDTAGICLDNFSLRGSSGLSLRQIAEKRLQEFNAVRPYDLIVLQYGLNVATQKGTNYDGYYKGMLSVIEHLKAAFPHAGILVVGVGDRAYKDERGELRTMPGVKNLIRYQQRLAAESHVAFWNLFEAMGGEGSMPAMVEAKPQLANYDYTHINFRGGRHLATLLYETLVYGLEQYERRKQYEADGGPL